jgi:hypothetical protein
MSNKERYKREIRSLRDLLNDNQYTRGLPETYHHFLADMHRKLVSDFKITPKMLDAIQNAAATYETYGVPQNRIRRDGMLSKVSHLKTMLVQCGYNVQYQYEKMEFLDSIKNRIITKGKLTPKQAKYANQLHKQFSKKIQKNP